MRTLPFALLASCLCLITACQQSSSASQSVAAPAQADLIARGEYVIRTTGCNDCHTMGYAESQGTLDKSHWLTGSSIGFKGPWGTTYATNLRLHLAKMDEAQWLDYSAKLHTRPIMPDFALRAMSVDDRRAIYHFIHALGSTGQEAPAYMPPGQVPPPPYYDLVLPPAPPSPVAAQPPAPAQG
jgi:hypothetical protein